jgi:hypothetical protein
LSLAILYRYRVNFLSHWDSSFLLSNLSYKWASNHPQKDLNKFVKNDGKWHCYGSFGTSQFFYKDTTQIPTTHITNKACKKRKGEKMTHIMVHFELTSFVMDDMI